VEEAIANYKGIPVGIFCQASVGGSRMPRAEGEAFLAACNAFLERSRPDAVLTYGGDPLCLAMFDLIKSRDIPLLFAMHNFDYGNPHTFRAMDYVVAPTEFCRQYYWRELGLACQQLLLPLDRERVEAKSRQPRYLTFVNPAPHKGSFVFARIAETLARRRPDIAILVVEASHRADSLDETGVDGRDWGTSR